MIAGKRASDAVYCAHTANAMRSPISRLGAQSQSPLELVKLTPLMALTAGRVEVMIGLIDGPALLNHPDLAGGNVREVNGDGRGSCAQADSIACQHGTFVAGILCAQRDSAAPAICPACTLLVHPIFAETPIGHGQLPSATPEELANAIIESIAAGARVLNLSVALAQPSSGGQHKLAEALGQAAKRGVVVVAAAGNQGAIGSSVITQHPWVIPVVACDWRGRPLALSNLGHSIGRRGLSAPGDNITSLGTEGKPLAISGTSVAAPFVTGAIALLWSQFPKATAAQVRLAVIQAAARQRTSIVPPLLDAWAAYEFMVQAQS